MVDYAMKELKELGFQTTLKDVGLQQCDDGSKIQLPPVIFAQLGNDVDKKTLLIYGHLDVQPAKMVWNYVKLCESKEIYLYEGIFN